MVLIEASLYVAGRPLDLKTLGSVVNVKSKKNVQRIARMLMKKYADNNTALEILELDDNRFVMQLKAEHSRRVHRLAIRPFLTEGPLKTLSYIAYRQPVLQTQVINVRGNHVYKYLKELEDVGLIKRNKIGRTKMIQTTKFFADYFGFSQNVRKMKRQLNKFILTNPPLSSSTDIKEV
jgi:segregation and condensation protein B